MTIKSIGNNQMEVKTSKGDTILISYNTPVAAIIEGKVYRTPKVWSQTTRNHLDAYLDGLSFELRPQSFFDSLI